MPQVAIDSGTLERLDATAAILSLSREDALRRVVETYAAWEQDFMADVEAGIASEKRGELYTDEEVRAEMATLKSAYLAAKKR